MDCIASVMNSTRAARRRRLQWPRSRPSASELVSETTSLIQHHTSDCWRRYNNTGLVSSSYQQNSWRSVAESSPRQNGRTFSSVLLTATVRLQHVLLQRFSDIKWLSCTLQTASSHAWWYRLCRSGIQTIQTDVRRADAEVKFVPLRTIDALVSDMSIRSPDNDPQREKQLRKMKRGPKNDRPTMSARWAKKRAYNII